MERTISFMNGEGSIGHNRRKFIANNVDVRRTENNIVLIDEDIKQVYHKLFDRALEEYNSKQKRKDRKIKNYYEKISRSKQEKLFYEVIVQIGNRKDTGVGSDMAEVAAKILQEYVERFQRNNLNLYVFGAYIHLDEETPHLHLDFVPWVSGCKRGLETRTSLKAALATRGFVGNSKGNTEWAQWAEVEKEEIADIMARYQIGWEKKNTHNQHLSVLDYKKQERMKEIVELETQIKSQQFAMAWEEMESQKKLAHMETETENLREVSKNTKLELEVLEGRVEVAKTLVQELSNSMDKEEFLREEVIELRYQNRILKDENRSLKDKLEMAYEFMKQFVIGGMNLLEKFLAWVDEKVLDLGRGR